ncbi:MAG: TetR/AcrR family transcriptional regulator [Acidimicrobiales bacterium]
MNPINDLDTQLAKLADEVATYGPRSVPTELRRRHVLVAAALEFVAHGFADATMQQIAARAGVTKPVVYGLFDSKDDLFVAVVDQTSNEMADRLAAATPRPGESHLGAGIRAFLHYVDERRALWGPLTDSSHHGAVAAALTRFQDRQVEFVTAALAEGYRERGVEPGAAEVEALARVVSGAATSMAEWMHRRPEVGPDEAAAFVDAALNPGLDAVRGADQPRWFS